MICPKCNIDHDIFPLRPITELGDLTELLIALMENLRNDLTQRNARKAALDFLDTQGFADLMIAVGQDPVTAREAMRRVAQGDRKTVRAVFRKQTRTPYDGEAA